MVKATNQFANLLSSATKSSCFQRVIVAVVWLLYLINSIKYHVVVESALVPPSCHQLFQRRSYFASERRRENFRHAVDSIYVENSSDNHVVDPIIVTFPIHSNTTFIHQYFMQLALSQAQRASQLYSEVPIGAIVVRNITTTLVATPATNDRNHAPLKQTYEILSKQHNRVEMNLDASAHAEMLALRDAAQNIQNWRLNSNKRTNNSNGNSQTILYCTLEPCIMCFAAAHAFRIDQLVYGAPDIRLGACGSYVNMIDFTSSSSSLSSSSSKHPYHTITNVTSGMYANESSLLLRNFFRQRRRQQQQPPQQQRPIPLPKRQPPLLSDSQVLSNSTTIPLPFYRRLWRKIALRFR